MIEQVLQRELTVNFDRCWFKLIQVINYTRIMQKNLVFMAGEKTRGQIQAAQN